MLGKIQNGKIDLNQFGRIVKNKWKDIPKSFKNVKSDRFIIMPNHIHGIIMITDVRAKHFINKNSFNCSKIRKKCFAPADSKN